MDAIGKLGKLVTFKTSDDEILNYNNFSREISGRWVTHDPIGKKTKSEYLGAGHGTITFTIELNAMFGVKPWKVMHKLRKAAVNGKVYPLIIGRHKVGKRKWYISRMGEMHNIVLDRGEILSATVELTLEEC